MDEKQRKQLKRGFCVIGIAFTLALINGLYTSTSIYDVKQMIVAIISFAVPLGLGSYYIIKKGLIHLVI